MVEYYGVATPIEQVASVNVPDAKTILVQPWERNMIGPIEKAILVSNIGLTPSNNGEHIRLTIPALTEERRKELVKQVKGYAETGKVSLRNARRDAVDAFKKAQKDGMPEDVAKDGEADVLTVVGGGKTDVAHKDSFLDGANHIFVPGLNEDGLCVGHIDTRHLLDGGCCTVVLNHNATKHMLAGFAGPYTQESLLEVVDSFGHLLLGHLQNQYFLVVHSLGCFYLVYNCLIFPIAADLPPSHTPPAGRPPGATRLRGWP